MTECAQTKLTLLTLTLCRLQESAEHYNRMLSERAQEIQELKKQLSDRQQELATAEKQSSSTAQESYLETAQLKALLGEKDSLINVRSCGIQHSHSAVKCVEIQTPKENNTFCPPIVCPVLNVF